MRLLTKLSGINWHAKIYLNTFLIQIRFMIFSGVTSHQVFQEDKKESFAIFQDMKGRVEEEIVRYLFWLRPVENQEARPAARRATPLTLNNPSAETVPAFAATGRTRPGVPAGAQQRPARAGGDDVVKTVRREEPKVGRNDPCPCGSGKKYKKCHGAQ